MNTDKVLALAGEAGGLKLLSNWERWEITEPELLRFAALIQREMEADGWRSPALKKDEAVAALIKVRNELNN